MAGMIGSIFGQGRREVKKDEARKKGIALFFSLFWRKLGKYALLSFWYFVTSIPALLFYAWLLLGLSNAEQLAFLEVLFALMGSFMLVTLLGGTPFASGFYYVIRNFYNEEHAWTVSDFLERTFKNIKQSLVVYLVDAVVIGLILFAIRFYLIMSVGNAINYVLLTLVLLVYAIYVMMHSYIWNMIVTFELKLRDIYKNAFILTIMGLGRNLWCLLLNLGLLLLMLGILPIPGMIFMAVLGFGMCGLTTEIIIFPVIKKHMLDPLTQPAQEETQTSTEGDIE